MLSIAHRGASGYAPENTFAAFRRALAMGVAFIETDLQLSRDARLVAIHDATVNRTTNGQGAVHDMTLAELRRLDAGSWFGSEFSGERIPTIEEILQFAGDETVGIVGRRARVDQRASRLWRDCAHRGDFVRSGDFGWRSQD